MNIAELLFLEALQHGREIDSCGNTGPMYKQTRFGSK